MPDPEPATNAETDAAAREPIARRRLIPVWAIPLLIGLVTITAGLFTWRAGQLASTAAYEDRQSVGQTITQQRQAVEVRMAAVDDAVAYVGYLADYAEAGAIDRLADELAAQGADLVAAGFAEEADALRLSTSKVAAASGLFGQQSLLVELASGDDQPLPFDVDDQVRRLDAEATTGVGSPGVPDPDTWADAADATRSRVRDLRWATFLLLVAVVGLTIAQLTNRVLTRRLGAAFGLVLYVTVVGTTAVTVF